MSKAVFRWLVLVGFTSLAALAAACSSPRDDAAPGPGDSGTPAATVDATANASDLDAGDAGGGSVTDADATRDADSDGGTSADAGGPVVTVQDGQLAGIVDGQTWSFRGIPYAAPPVGTLRWALPAAAPAWSGVRDASTFASSCVQIGDGGVEGSEDCLYLNVWTPAPSSAGSHPVMVFIHGGGLSQGAGSDPLYEGADLAQHTGAVVVTLNYRLGSLGFLAHPELSAENDPPTSGNYGLLDQVAALRWVQANAASFGGDPSNVTLFGESAGATSTVIQVLSPLAKGLFKQAIFESTGIFPQYPTLATAQTAGQGLAADLGCSGSSGVAACLRAVPAKTVIAKTAADDWTFPDLLTTSLGYRLLPVIDDYVLTGQPFPTFAAGGHNHLPIVLGNNATEAGYFAALHQIPTVTDIASYTAAMNTLLGSNASAVLAEYPAASDATAMATYLQALTDGAFVCRTRKLARAILQGQSQPVYRYDFTQALGGAEAQYGAFHTIELFFLFHTLGAYGYPETSADDAVSTTIQRYWGNFAASGNPNDGSSVAWSVNTATTDPYLQIGATTQAASGFDSAACDFWDTVGLY